MTKVFPDALLNRLLVVPYYPISKDVLQRIIGLNLSRVQKRVQENHKVPFAYDENVPKLIAKRCTELERGARMVDTRDRARSSTRSTWRVTRSAKPSACATSSMGFARS